MQLEEIDVVGAETAKAGVDGASQREAGRPDVVRTGPVAEAGLGRDEDALAAAGDGLAENLLGQAVGINIGAVEHVEPGVETDVEQTCRLGSASGAPVFEELVAAAKRASAEREHRDEETRAAKLPVFHVIPVMRCAWEVYPIGWCLTT